MPRRAQWKRRIQPGQRHVHTGPRTGPAPGPHRKASTASPGEQREGRCTWKLGSQGHPRSQGPAAPLRTSREVPGAGGPAEAAEAALSRAPSPGERRPSSAGVLGGRLPSLDHRSRTTSCYSERAHRAASEPARRPGRARRANLAGGAHATPRFPSHSRPHAVSLRASSPSGPAEGRGARAGPPRPGPPHTKLRGQRRRATVTPDRRPERLQPAALHTAPSPARPCALPTVLLRAAPRRLPRAWAPASACHPGFSAGPASRWPRRPLPRLRGPGPSLPGPLPDPLPGVAQPPAAPAARAPASPRRALRGAMFTAAAPPRGRREGRGGGAGLRAAVPGGGPPPPALTGSPRRAAGRGPGGKPVRPQGSRRPARPARLPGGLLRGARPRTLLCGRPRRALSRRGCLPAAGVVRAHTHLPSVLRFQHILPEPHMHLAAAHVEATYVSARGRGRAHKVPARIVPRGRAAGRRLSPPGQLRPRRSADAHVSEVGDVALIAF